MTSLSELSFGDQVQREALILKVAHIHRRRRLKSKTVLALKYRMGWGPRK